jgi:hypothetical protein
MACNSLCSKMGKEVVDQQASFLDNLPVNLRTLGNGYEVFVIQSWAPDLGGGGSGRRYWRTLSHDHKTTLHCKHI